MREIGGYEIPIMLLILYFSRVYQMKSSDLSTSRRRDLVINLAMPSTDNMGPWGVPLIECGAGHWYEGPAEISRTSVLPKF